MNPGKCLFVHLALIALLSLSVINIIGCTHLRQAVISLPNREVVALDADGIVRIMQRAGFSDEEILDLGTDLRNCLALRGAAQIRVGNKTEAIFAVHTPHVHVSSRQRGSFIYNVQAGEVR